MCAFVCVRVGMYESVCIEKKYRKSVEKIYTCKKILVLPACFATLIITTLSMCRRNTLRGRNGHRCRWVLAFMC